MHATRYAYAQAVDLCHNEARLTPRQTAWQHCLETRLEIDPPPVDQRQRQDYFGNQVTYFAVERPHRRMSVRAISRVRVEALRPQGTAAGESAWEEARRRLPMGSGGEALSARLFALDSPLIESSAELCRYAERSFRRGRGLVEAAHELMSRIHREFEFVPGFTTVATPLAQVLEHRRGVCQDFAHLGIGCLRSLGLAARYMSGYIETLPPPGGQRLVGADASHAWFSLYVPERGWMDFDPTNDQVPGERHIALAWGRDYGDVAPLKGVAFGGGRHELYVSVDVEREAG